MSVNNVSKLQAELEGFSDQQLIESIKGGSAPQYLVLAEMQRRKKMRSEAQSKPQKPSSVLADNVQGLAGMPQNPMVQMYSGGIVGFAGGKSVSAYEKGVSEACYKNEATGQTECPRNARMLQGPKHTKFKTQKFATGRSVERDEVRKLLESSNRQFDKDGNVILGPEVNIAGQTERAVGKNQVLPSTAMQPGYEKYGAVNVFDLADELGIEYGTPSYGEATRLLTNEAINDAFAVRYQDAMSNRFGEDQAFNAYHAGPGNVAKGNIGPATEAYNAKAQALMGEKALDTQTAADAIAALGESRGGLGYGENQPVLKYPNMPIAAADPADIAEYRRNQEDMQNVAKALAREEAQADAAGLAENAADARRDKANRQAQAEGRRREGIASLDAAERTVGGDLSEFARANMMADAERRQMAPGVANSLTRNPAVSDTFYPTDAQREAVRAGALAYGDRISGGDLTETARRNILAAQERQAGGDLSEFARANMMADAERQQMTGIPNMPMPEGVLAAMGETKMPLRGGEQLSTQELKDMAAESRAIRSEKAPVETWTVDDFDANPEIKDAFQRYLKHQEAYHDQQDANKEYAGRNYLGKALNEPGRFFFGADEQLPFYPDFASFQQAEKMAKQKPMTAEEGIAALGEQKMTLRGGERQSTAEQRKAKSDRAETNAAADAVEKSITDTIYDRGKALLEGITSVRDRKLAEKEAKQDVIDEAEFEAEAERRLSEKPGDDDEGISSLPQSKGAAAKPEGDFAPSRSDRAKSILGYGTEPKAKKGIDALVDDKLFQLGVGMIRRGGQTGDFGLALGQATQDVIDTATKEDASLADNQAAMDRALLAYEAAIYKADTDAIATQKKTLLSKIADLDKDFQKNQVPTEEQIAKYNASRKLLLDLYKNLERGTTGAKISNVETD